MPAARILMVSDPDLRVGVSTVGLARRLYVGIATPNYYGVDQERDKYLLSHSTGKLRASEEMILPS